MEILRRIPLFQMTGKILYRLDPVHFVPFSRHSTMQLICHYCFLLAARESNLAKRNTGKSCVITSIPFQPDFPCKWWTPSGFSWGGSSTPYHTVGSGIIAHLCCKKRYLNTHHITNMMLSGQSTDHRARFKQNNLRWTVRWFSVESMPQCASKMIWFQGQCYVPLKPSLINRYREEICLRCAFKMMELNLTRVDFMQVCSLFK